MAVVHLNWFNWLHFLILEGGLLVTLIDCMIFQQTFLDVTRIFMSTVSFLAQLYSMTLGLELIDAFYLQVLFML